MNELNEALQICSQAHRNQVDRNGQPYIMHPIRVMLAMATEEERIVALLHDVVEDAPMDWGHGDILALFGERVHAAVYALTRKNEETYADFILRCKDNELARKVKIADIRDNLRPGAEHLRERYLKAITVLEG